jgi:hypothetical protein
MAESEDIIGYAGVYADVEDAQAADVKAAIDEP